MNFNHSEKGFTLIELLVAIGLFSIIVTIAIGGFVNVLKTQRQVAALIAVQSNAGLALEQIAREARTGYLFCRDIGGVSASASCDCNPSTGSTWVCKNLDFYNAETANIKYSCPGCDVGAGTLDRADATQNGGTAEPITADDVVIKYLTFTLFGDVEGDHWNPRITISMGVSAKSNDPALASNVLHLETTVSARQIDCASGPNGC